MLISMGEKITQQKHVVFERHRRHLFLNVNCSKCTWRNQVEVIIINDRGLYRDFLQLWVW